MDNRRARRLATTRLAAVARLHSDQSDELDELSPADRIRVRRAFADLAHELEVRAGLQPRVAPTAPVDPDQVPLFVLREEELDVDSRRESPSPAQGADGS